MEKTYLSPREESLSLAKWDSNDTGTFNKKKPSIKALNTLRLELKSLQEVLYAEHKHKILIVLQAMDTGGKDGTIRHIFSGVNPQGIRVVSFKAPTQREVDYDYLWRIHNKVPPKGFIGIFNRSHYEDVLIARVHNFVDQKQWEKRYRHIREFERMLSDEGTHILKFYLHISKDEQKKRLERRLKLPEKNWKFEMADINERKLWDNYISAYEDAINNTNTQYAPWHIIPSNHKWYRNYIIAKILVDKLKSLNMKYPEPKIVVSKIKID